MDAALLASARSWIRDDPDPLTRAAAEDLLATGDERAIRACFGDRLAFGTAGLRGALGPGPNRMNRALVRRVTAGLATWLLGRVDGRAPVVVIGFDARQGSRPFADDAARALTALGIVVYTHDDLVPTPELAFAVKHLGCDAGIMVTASHNPPGDNGYKVYAGNGAQIVPPVDEEISAAIDLVRRTPAADGPAPLPVPPESRAAYVRAVLGLRVTPAVGARIVYTAMHGVGTARVRQVLSAAGHVDLHLVPTQCEPDGTFPTVAFPNPEEKGALDHAVALATRVDADVILANDPDADRLAVAVPDGRGGWRQLTGNQVGCLLAEHLLTHGAAEGDRLVACSLVSSAMTSRIAAAHGARYVETLTGFKWIANAGLLPHVAAGGRFVLGFEEALGYCVGSAVHDKDGVSAALILADMASWAKDRGSCLGDLLVALYRRYGLYGSDQLSLQLPQGEEGVRTREEIMGHLRREPPNHLADVPVVAIRDLLSGKSLDVLSGVATSLDLPPSDVLAFDLADGSRVLCRPSGTEPKVKLYFEVREPMSADEPLATAEGRVTQRLAALREAVTAHLDTRAQRA